MIFVVLGTQKFQCNRLLEQIDKLIELKKISEDVFAQIGHSTYKPKNFSFTDFLNKDEFEEKMSCCDLLITHSGVGTIISGMNKNKKIIVYPRLKKYGEHIDNHQLEIAEAFADKRYVLLCGENDNLEEVIRESQEFKFEKYISHNKIILKTINDFIGSEV